MMNSEVVVIKFIVATRGVVSGTRPGDVRVFNEIR